MLVTPAALWLALTAPALAQDEPVVDVTRTMVFSNAEVLAMGGAGSAFGGGARGMVTSPAAPANRRIEAVGPILASFVFIQSKINDDRDASTQADETRNWDLGLGGGYNHVAVGALTEGYYARVDDEWVAAIEGALSVAVAFPHLPLVVGAGPRFLGVRLTDADGRYDDLLGAGFEAGAIVVHENSPWSAALTLRSGVKAVPLDDAELAAAKIAPDLVAGLGWTNVGMLQKDSGLPVRLAIDVAVQAPVHDAEALAGWLNGETIARGDWYTVSPRIGGELGVWRDRLRLRTGGYLEPSRTSLSDTRAHVTGGFDVRLFRVRLFHERIKLDIAWQVGADYAQDYFRGAWLGLNVWQSGQMGGKPKTESESVQPPKSTEDNP
jgi:hypothetical protein